MGGEEKERGERDVRGKEEEKKVEMDENGLRLAGTRADLSVALSRFIWSFLSISSVLQFLDQLLMIRESTSHKMLC